jgi:hypothetical protein
MIANDFKLMNLRFPAMDWICYVKSVPNYFYGQLYGNFTRPDTPIPFRKVFLNVGGGINETKGIFTAPVNGKSFFFFIRNCANSW